LQSILLKNKLFLEYLACGWRYVHMPSADERTQKAPICAAPAPNRLNNGRSAGDLATLCERDGAFLVRRLI
jgi:hypothetical protein